MPSDFNKRQKRREERKKNRKTQRLANEIESDQLDIHSESDVLSENLSLNSTLKEQPEITAKSVSDTIQTTDEDDLLYYDGVGVENIGSVCEIKPGRSGILFDSKKQRSNKEELGYAPLNPEGYNPVFSPHYIRPGDQFFSIPGRVAAENEATIINMLAAGVEGVDEKLLGLPGNQGFELVRESIPRWHSRINKEVM